MANKPTKSTEPVTVLASVFDIVSAETGEVLIAKGQTGPLPKDKADILVKKNLAKYATLDPAGAGTPTQPPAVTGA
jgi:hypothetical protein